MKKVLICQEAITYLNVYITNSRNSKYQYMQQKVVEVREEIDKTKNNSFRL